MVEVLPLGVKVWLKYLGNCSVVMLYTTKQRPLFGFRPSWYLWPDHRKGSDESKRWRVCSVSSWCILGDFNGKSEQQIVFPNLQNIWKYSQFETKRRASWGTKNENVDTKYTELVPNNCFLPALVLIQQPCTHSLITTHFILYPKMLCHQPWMLQSSSIESLAHYTSSSFKERVEVRPSIMLQDVTEKLQHFCEACRVIVPDTCHALYHQYMTGEKLRLQLRTQMFIPSPRKHA